MEEKFFTVGLLDDCWEWRGEIDKVTGYGKAHQNGKRRAAHRVVYEHFVGVIPKGLVLDHLCRNRRCVNPYHLEPVTQLENIRRGESPMGIMLRTGYCQRGHEMTPENTIYITNRRCRICYNEACRKASKKYNARKRSEQLAQRGPTAKELVKEFFASMPYGVTVSPRDLHRHFSLKPNSIDFAVRKLLKEGFIYRERQGHYARSR